MGQASYSNSRRPRAVHRGHTAATVELGKPKTNAIFTFARQYRLKMVTTKNIFYLYT